MLKVLLCTIAIFVSIDRCSAALPLLHFFVNSSISASVKKSNYVAVVKISAIERPALNMRSPSDIVYSPFHISFDKVLGLKGQVPNSERNILVSNLSFPTNADLLDKLAVGTYALIIWNMQDGSPAHEDFPIIPLGSLDPDVRLAVGSEQPSDYAVASIISAMKSGPLRQLLSNFIVLDNCSFIPEGLYPYLNDSDPVVKFNILRCMATCQQVAAIPLIQRQIHAWNGGQFADLKNMLLLSLEGYENSASGLVMCHLLFDTDYQIREAAAKSLFKIQSTESLPFLILALRDPEQKVYVREHCFETIFDLTPELLHLRDFPSDEQLTNYPGTWAGAVNNWWTDELNHKHGVSRVFGADNVQSFPQADVDAFMVPFTNLDPALRFAAVSNIDLSNSSDLTVEFIALGLEDRDVRVQCAADIKLEELCLNPPKIDPDAVGGNLFRFDASQRLVAVSKLELNSDADESLPYLMIALQDPSPSVGFVAYQKIANFAGISTEQNIGPITTLSQYSAVRDEADDAIYSWWSKRLGS